MAEKFLVPKPSKLRKQVAKQRRSKGKTPNTARFDAVNLITMPMLRALVADPFPQRAYKVLTWNQQSQIVTTGTTCNELNVLLNSAYDPGNGGAGALQPNYWDTMTSIYDSYQVHRVEAQVQFYEPSGDGLLVGFQIQGDTTQGGTIANIASRPLTQVASLSNTGEQVVNYNFDLSIWDVLGFSKAQYVSDTSLTGASVNAAPGVIAFLRLFTAQSVGTTTSVQVNIRFKMHVQFYDRKSVAASTV